MLLSSILLNTSLDCKIFQIIFFILLINVITDIHLVSFKLKYGMFNKTLLFLKESFYIDFIQKKVTDWFFYKILIKSTQFFNLNY
jgi:hypothetical protein